MRGPATRLNMLIQLSRGKGMRLQETIGEVYHDGLRKPAHPYRQTIKDPQPVSSCSEQPLLLVYGVCEALVKTFFSPPSRNREALIPCSHRMPVQNPSTLIGILHMSAGLSVLTKHAASLQLHLNHWICFQEIKMEWQRALAPQYQIHSPYLS